MAGSAGSASQKRNRDKQRAAELKRLGIERTTGKCAVCYRTITVESRLTRYTHICKG